MNILIGVVSFCMMFKLTQIGVRTLDMICRDIEDLKRQGVIKW